MAYAHGITRDDVFAAASAIFAQGKNPTQAAVRAALGKGSFATINKHLSDWRQERQEAEVTLNEDENIPDEDLRLLRRFYWTVRATVEATSVSEAVEVLEKENQELRERQANYDAIAAELAGIRFAHQQALERLDSLTRENERLTQAAAKTSTRKPRSPKSTAS